MSTVRLKKDHGEHKAGATISVPFGAGRDLIAAGVAEYPAGPAPAVAPAQPPGDMALVKKQQDRIANLEQENAKLAAEVARLKDENAKLALDLEQATKPPAKTGEKK